VDRGSGSHNHWFMKPSTFPDAPRPRRRRLRGLLAALPVAAWALVAGCDAAPSGAPAAPPADVADSLAEAEASGEAEIRVLYVAADGFAYHGSDGRLTGVTVEMMRQFAAWVGRTRGVQVTVDFEEEEDWRTFYSRVRDAGAGVFGIGNVTITGERSRELRFSPPYLTNVAVLITPAHVPELPALAAAPELLAGLQPLAFRGTLHEARLRALRDEHLPGVELAMAGSNAEIVERVAGGGHFAYVDAYNYWRARDQGAPLRRHPVADDPAEEFGVIMPLGNDWAPLLDEFFQDGDGYRNTPAYQDLLVRHLGQPLAEALEAARRARPGR
jgi:hypothetical protein